MSSNTLTDYIPWEARPGWEDVKPIPQNDGPNPIVAINYTEEYRNAMDNFRYLISVQEKSERVLELTETLIKLNPGHYTVWTYRSRTLIALGADLTKELDLMESLIKEHLKSYQVWQHRRTVVLALNSETRELPFTERALKIDAKNYHTWAYRQWALCHFYGLDSRFDQEKKLQIWKEELKFTEKLIKEDVRNNSVWNHRFFIIFESGMGQGKDEKSVLTELEYCYEKLDLVPNNASVWNYLGGMIRKCQKPYSTLSSIVEKHIIISNLALEMRAEILIEASQPIQAVQIFEELKERDPIRIPLWNYRINLLLP